jgi:hypothetical protein
MSLSDNDLTLMATIAELRTAAKSPATRAGGSVGWRPRAGVTDEFLTDWTAGPACRHASVRAFHPCNWFAADLSTWGPKAGQTAHAVAIRRRRWGGMASRTLTLRNPDACRVCEASLPAGSQGFWDADSRHVTCLPCHVAGAASVSTTMPDAGVPGASLIREYERRKGKRDARTREAHPHIGGLLLALSDEPQQQAAFRRGAQGEAAVAKTLERRLGDGLAAMLFNRRMPGGRGDIDAVAVAPTGVYVIDAKHWKGKLKIARPLFGAEKLLINGRDRTKLIDGLDRQVEAVRHVLRDAAPEVPVHGVLCFTEIDMPMFRTQVVRGHRLMYRKALAKRLNAAGPLGTATVEAAMACLAAALPPA